MAGEEGGNGTVPADAIFGSFSDVMKSVSASIKAIGTPSSGKEFNNLEIDVDALVECCQGLCSATVLISEPRVLDNFVADESSGLRLLLTQALIMGSIRNSDVQGLSTLPEKEARFWHLSVVREATMANQTLSILTNALALTPSLLAHLNENTSNISFPSSWTIPTMRMQGMP